MWAKITKAGQLFSGAKVRCVPHGLKPGRPPEREVKHREAVPHRGVVIRFTDGAEILLSDLKRGEYQVKEKRVT